MEEHLTTKQVAEALSVSESSVKRWCDRGVIPTVRTVGGHRRIPVLSFMEFVENTNRNAGHLPTERSDVASNQSVETFEELQEKFCSAMENGDEAVCRRLLIEWRKRSKCFASIADELIGFAFHRLGELWGCGKLEVYQERRGCEICSRMLHELRGLIPEPPSDAPLAIGGSTSGDHYTLPTQLVELVLKDCSWRAVNLGNNLPFDTILAAVKEHKPRLLWLSVSHVEDTEAFVDDYKRFSSQLPSDLMIVLGGRALTDAVRPRLKYTGYCDNMQQLASFGLALHGQRRSIGTSFN